MTTQHTELIARSERIASELDGHNANMDRRARTCIRELLSAIEALETMEKSHIEILLRIETKVDELIAKRDALQAENTKLHTLRHEREDVISELRNEVEAQQAELERLNACLKQEALARENVAAMRAELAAQLAAAQGQEPLHWVVPYYGFTFPTQEAAQRHQDNLECVDKPIACYAAPIPQQVAEPSYAAIHMEHCFQPPYETSCKYGDSDCPAQQAQPERAPLSLEEINAEARELDDAALECGFRTGVRWAEKRHGIKQGAQHD